MCLHSTNGRRLRADPAAARRENYFPVEQRAKYAKMLDCQCLPLENMLGIPRK
jgi:hypothetical protein